MLYEERSPNFLRNKVDIYGKIQALPCVRPWLFKHDADTTIKFWRSSLISHKKIKNELLPFKSWEGGDYSAKLLWTAGSEAVCIQLGDTCYQLKILPDGKKSYGQELGLLGKFTESTVQNLLLIDSNLFVLGSNAMVASLSICATDFLAEKKLAEKRRLTANLRLGFEKRFDRDLFLAKWENETMRMNSCLIVSNYAKNCLYDIRSEESFCTLPGKFLDGKKYVLTQLDNKIKIYDMRKSVTAYVEYKESEKSFQESKCKWLDDTHFVMTSRDVSNRKRNPHVRVLITQNIYSRWRAAKKELSYFASNSDMEVSSTERKVYVSSLSKMGFSDFTWSSTSNALRPVIRPQDVVEEQTSQILFLEKTKQLLVYQKKRCLVDRFEEGKTILKGYQLQ